MLRPDMQDWDISCEVLCRHGRDLCSPARLTIAGHARRLLLKEHLDDRALAQLMHPGAGPFSVPEGQPERPALPAHATSAYAG